MELIPVIKASVNTVQYYCRLSATTALSIMCQHLNSDLSRISSQVRWVLHRLHLQEAAEVFLHISPCTFRGSWETFKKLIRLLMMDIHFRKCYFDVPYLLSICRTGKAQLQSGCLIYSVSHTIEPFPPLGRGSE